MYEELIRQIMACCKGMPCKDANCGFNPKSDLDCIEQLLIRAVEAIEELQKDLERSKDFEAFWQHEAEEVLKKFQVVISNKPRWIPVSEKLPPISEEAIVCTYTNMIRIWSLERYYPTVADVLWEREDGYYEDVSEVTHWMPLPEPPKENEE